MSQLSTLNRSRVGRRIATAADSLADQAGAKHPLLGTDSATVLVLLDALCGECRDEASSFAAFAQWAELQGAAVRLIVPNPPRVAEGFERQVGSGRKLLLAQPSWYRQLGVEAAPTVYMLDGNGVVHARWLGRVPPRLAVLNILSGVGRSGN